MRKLGRNLSRVAIIGLGAIGRTVVDRLLDGSVVKPAPECIALVRRQHLAELEGLYGSRLRLVTSFDELMAVSPDIVVDAAGQPAVREFAEQILTAGIDFLVVSTGALVDDAFRSRLITAGETSGARLIVAAGAIAGLDGLGALKLSGNMRARYISIKPPLAWRGTPAETMLDLDQLVEATTFFRGSAADAATRFPKNANLAATIALAGAGFDNTIIELVADPNSKGNCGRIETEASAGKLIFELSGPSAAENAKTSAITAFSILAALKGHGQTIVFR